MFLLKRVVILFYYLILTVPAGAYEVEELDTLVVSATRSEQTVINTPSAISIITSSDIEESGADNLARILRIAAGVQISDLFGDGSNSQVNLRGFGETAQQNTLVLIDGRRLNNTDNGAPDLNSISINDIERIEIIKGSASTLFGDKAVGGVINIITRSPGEFQASVKLKTGNYRYRSLTASAGERFKNGVGIRFNAERRLADNYREENDQWFNNIFTKADYQHDSGSLFLEYQNIRQDLETPGPLFKDQVIDNRRQPLNPNDFINTHTWIARTGIVQEISENWVLLAEYTNRRTDSNSVISTFGVPGFSFLDRNYREWTPRLSGSIPFPAGDANITIGYDYLNVDYSLISSVGITLDEQIQQGVYGQAVIPLSENLDLTIGGRHGRVENDIFASTVFLGVALPAGSEIDDTSNAGEIGLSYRVDNKLRIFARGEHFFRFATADEYSGIANFNAGLFPVPPFPFPIPLPTTQTGESYEFGFQWQGREANINAVFYQMDTRDEIAFEPATGVNLNIGDTRRRGVTLELDFELSADWDLYTNYSYINAEIVSGVFKGSDITFVADHVASIATGYRLMNGLKAYLEVQGISSRAFGGDFANVFSRLPGHVVGNLNLDYKPGNYQFGLRINNILDKKYSDAGNIGFDFRNPFFPQAETFFPAPERNFLFTIGYTYN